jgi:hypothetical protein
MPLTMREEDGEDAFDDDGGMMAIGSAVVVVTVAIFVVVVTGVATTRDDDDDDDDDDDTPSTREENGFGIARRHPQAPPVFLRMYPHDGMEASPSRVGRTVTLFTSRMH